MKKGTGGPRGTIAGTLKKQEATKERRSTPNASRETAPCPAIWLVSRFNERNKREKGKRKKMEEQRHNLPWLSGVHSVRETRKNDHDT